MSHLTRASSAFGPTDICVDLKSEGCHSIPFHKQTAFMVLCAREWREWIFHVCPSSLGFSCWHAGPHISLPFTLWLGRHLSTINFNGQDLLSSLIKKITISYYHYCYCHGRNEIICYSYSYQLG
jgi:hypothetical protein